MGQHRDRGPDLLFETPVDRVLAGAPRPVAVLLQRFLEEPLRPIDQLRSEVRSYLGELEAISRDAEFIDLGLARRIAAQCEALLATLGPTPSQEAHRLVQLAVRYFIEDDDAEGDTTSPIGFDDDAEVVRLVARELGQEQILEITAEKL